MHPVTIQQPNDDFMQATSFSKEGVPLAMRYNNTDHTARFILKGDTIALTQDTTASGIRYHNRTYVYTERQGQGTLTKDGEIIFQSVP